MNVYNTKKGVIGKARATEGALGKSCVTAGSVMIARIQKVL